MIAPLLLSTLLAAPAQGAKFRLERIEIVSDDTGAWLNYDVPMLGAHPLMVGFRLVEQTQLVWSLPVENLKVGTGLESITVSYERSMSVDLGGGDVGWYGGLTTRLLMPRGVTAGVDWTKKRLRLAAGASMTSASTWARPGFGVWSPMPVLSVAVVTGKAEDKRFRSAPVDRTEFRQDSALPADGAAAPVEGTAAPAEGTAAPVEGTAAPAEGTARELPTAPAEGTAAPAEGTGAPAEGTAAPADSTAAPADNTARELPAAPPAEEVAPTPQGVVLPTGPTAVEFGAPTQVVLPGDAPTQVLIGGGDDSSQEDDAEEKDD